MYYQLHCMCKRKQNGRIFIRPSINALQGNAFKHVHRTLDEDLLEDPLSRENYKAKFHQLLCLEEEHDQVLATRL